MLCGNDSTCAQVLSIALRSIGFLVIGDNDLRQCKVRAAVTDQSEMLIQVIDNGPGVYDPEKIFDAFVTTKEKGMGIGLAVSHSIVEAHGGRLWAENNPDGGATLSVVLPLSSERSKSN